MPSRPNDPQDNIEYASLSTDHDPRQEERGLVPPKGAFVKYQWLSYGLALLTLLIVVLSLAFYGIISRRGNVPAPQSLEIWVNENRRLSIQVVAVLASLLTATMKWGLGRAFTFVAQKRFSNRRTVFEAEFWTSMKNGGIIVVWSLDRIYILATVATAIVALLCGLMTSGFVALLSPLPVNLVENIEGGLSGGYQVDLLLVNNSEPCSKWFYDSARFLDTYGRNMNYVYCNSTWQVMAQDNPDASCGHATETFNMLDAGRSSMLRHIFESTSASAKDPRQFASPMSKFTNIRILGGTAGTIPLGPRGVEPFKIWPIASRSLLGSRLNISTIQQYTLTQQALFADISCQYIEDSALPYAWPPPYSNVSLTNGGGRGIVKVQRQCPGEIPGVLEIKVLEEGLFMVTCGANSLSKDIYLKGYRFLPRVYGFEKPPYEYAGIGSMKCTSTPKIGSVKVTYNSSIDAFTMTPQDEVSTVLNYVNRTTPASELLSWWKYRLDMESWETGTSGNLIGSLINELSGQYFGAVQDRKSEHHPALVASVLKGMFDLYTSDYMMALEVKGREKPYPAECRFPINGTINYQLIGWNAQSSTTLSLIPLGIIGGLIGTLILAVMFHQDRLKLFDPTRPVSLITAASASNVPLRPEAYGDPDDDESRKARITYGSIPDSLAILDARDRESIQSIVSEASPEEMQKLIAKVEDIIRAKLPQRDNVWGLYVEPAESRTTTPKEVA